jgi:hypothetical protein
VNPLPASISSPRGAIVSRSRAASSDRDYGLNGVVGEPSLRIFNAILKNKDNGFFQALFRFFNRSALSIRTLNLRTNRPVATFGSRFNNRREFAFHATDVRTPGDSGKRVLFDPMERRGVGIGQNDAGSSAMTPGEDPTKRDGASRLQHSGFDSNDRARSPGASGTDERAGSPRRYASRDDRAAEGALCRWRSDGLPRRAARVSQ